VGDVDGDGKLEVVVAGYSGELFLYTGDGDLKESHPMPQSTNASPTIADLGRRHALGGLHDGDRIGVGYAARYTRGQVQWLEYSARGGGYLPPGAQSPVRIQP
jgi:hypothetical protein